MCETCNVLRFMIQMLKDERTLFEEKTQRYKDSIDDLTNEKDELQRTYQM